MASPSAKTLLILADQLGVPAASKNHEGAGSSRKRSSVTAGLLLCEDDEDCDFSSFPSLSLVESAGNYHRGIFTSRGEVESHVESLLSRPILLGKQVDSAEDPESDSLDEFVVENFDEVPELMLSNFCSSFSTLMNSRLRAYASFLARHALTLASEHEDEGAIGIEQKLEAMMGIGSQIIVSSSTSQLVVGETPLPQKPEQADPEDGTICHEMPMEMKIFIDITLPHARQVDGNVSMTTSFQASGKICGIFSSKDDSLLRVAEVSLNMHELLTVMTEQASKVISRIVEMTNAAHSVPLPVAPHGIANMAPLCSNSSKSGGEARKRKEVSWSEEAAETATIVSLSQEKCANIVDFVIGELSDNVLSLPVTKKLKINDVLPRSA